MSGWGARERCIPMRGWWQRSRGGSQLAGLTCCVVLESALGQGLKFSRLRVRFELPIPCLSIEASEPPAKRGEFLP